jgi:hypothetical protein
VFGQDIIRTDYGISAFIKLAFSASAGAAAAAATTSGYHVRHSMSHTVLPTNMRGAGQQQDAAQKDVAQKGFGQQKGATQRGAAQRGVGKPQGAAQRDATQRGIRQHQNTAQKGAAQPGTAQRGLGQQRGAAQRKFHEAVAHFLKPHPPSHPIKQVLKCDIDQKFENGLY